MVEAKIPVMAFNEFSEFILESYSGNDSVDGEDAYGPELRDLYSLYSKVRNNKIVAVMEFGAGWSTLALFKALDENRRDFGEYVYANIRHPNPFTLMSVDCSEQFLSLALGRIPKELSETTIIPVVSTARMTTLNGQICSLFEAIPPFTADFIYLDGPDCEQVSGDVNGFSVRFGADDYAYGLPMAADLVLLEPFFWPGTLLVTDGRGANANFLKNNFKRNWEYRYDLDCDHHIFRLSEHPFGAISASLLTLKEGWLGVE
jgi:hypothetical protein